jgi:hypothetical protein
MLYKGATSPTAKSHDPPHSAPHGLVFGRAHDPRARDQLVALALGSVDGAASAVALAHVEHHVRGDRLAALGRAGVDALPCQMGRRAHRARGRGRSRFDERVRCTLKPDCCLVKERSKVLLCGSTSRPTVVLVVLVIVVLVLLVLTRSPGSGPPVVGVRRPACWAGGQDHDEASPSYARADRSQAP